MVDAYGPSMDRLWTPYEPLMGIIGAAESGLVVVDGAPRTSERLMERTRTMCIEVLQPLGGHKFSLRTRFGHQSILPLSLALSLSLSLLYHSLLSYGTRRWGL